MSTLPSSDLPVMSDTGRIEWVHDEDRRIPTRNTVEDLPIKAIPEHVPALGGALGCVHDNEAGRAHVGDEGPAEQLG